MEYGLFDEAGKSIKIGPLLDFPGWGIKPTFSDHIVKVESILKGSLDSIPSPSPSVKIQIRGGKVCLRCKGKTLLGVVNKH